MLPRTKSFLVELWNGIEEDNVFDGAAALAFYLVLSLFPAAIFLLTLLPYLPIADLQQAILAFLHQVLPEESAALVQSVVLSVTSERKGGLLTFGLLFALWLGSTGICAIIQQLNITCEVKEERPYWKVRLIAVALLFLFLLFIIGAFMLIVFGGNVQAAIAGVVGWSKALLVLFAILRWIVIAAFLLLGFETIYFFGPDVKQKFRLISPGSVVGVVLLGLTSLGFRYYIAHFGNYNATYGSLGAIMILLMWMYIAGLVLLLGSEVNAVLKPYGRE